MLQTKLIRKQPAPLDAQQQPENNPCLMEFNFGISIDSMLLANGPVFIEKIHIIMNETKAVIHEAFYDFIRDAKSLNKTRQTDRRCIEDTQTVDADEVYQRISHIIPKVGRTVRG